MDNKQENNVAVPDCDESVTSSFAQSEVSSTTGRRSQSQIRLFRSSSANAAVPNSSFAVLRRPQVMVGSNSEDICSINVPLGDGWTLSIPPGAVRPKDLVDLEDKMEQLVQLRDHLDFVIQNQIAGTNHPAKET